MRSVKVKCHCHGVLADVLDGENNRILRSGLLCNNAKYTVSEKDCTLFFFLGAQCVESGVSFTECY